MGILLGLRRTHARAAPGERAYDYKPFYRGSKVSVIGAISESKVLAVMTLDDSMDSAAFKVYISKCLVPQLWKGAVQSLSAQVASATLWRECACVMDNLPAHKVKAMREAKLPQSPSETMARMRRPLIEAVGAKILYLSPYSRPVQSD